MVWAKFPGILLALGLVLGCGKGSPSATEGGASKPAGASAETREPLPPRAIAVASPVQRARDLALGRGDEKQVRVGAAVGCFAINGQPAEHAELPQDIGVSGGGCPAMRDTRALKWSNGGAVCAASASDVRGAPTPESPVTVCCQ